MQLKYLGLTLSKTAPLIMVSLSVLFAFKAGLFNIGVAGQYVIGACVCLYAAIIWQLSWFSCMLLAGLAGAFFGGILGILKAYKKVNEVISGILVNWMALYFTNMILTSAKDLYISETCLLKNQAPKAILPSVGLKAVFGEGSYVTIAIPLAIIIAIIIYIILNKTKLGYEIKATGFNRDATKYCGMSEKKNIIVSLVISGCLAGLGASFLYLTDIERWILTSKNIPPMGFNGILGAFIGLLNPIGTIFSSFFIQSITDSSISINSNAYSPKMTEIILSIIVYLFGLFAFLKLVIFGKKRREK